MLTAVRKAISPRPRQGLRAAIAARVRAEALLEQRKGHMARLRATIDAADKAEADHAEAEKAAEASARDWQMSDALEPPPEHQVLLDRVLEKARNVDNARLTAKGAAHALPQVQKAQEEAEYALQDADAAVTRAIGAVLLEEASPRLEELRRIVGQIPQLMTLIADLDVLHSLASRHSADGLSRELSPMLQVIDEFQQFLRLPIHQARHASHAWGNLAQQLRKDADAQPE